METLAKIQLSCAAMAMLISPMAAVVVCEFAVVIVADIGPDGT
jgi:hypothetical protein